MRLAHANGIEIAYETFGDRAGRPLLLIIGYGAQMIAWSEELCNQLASSGHYVIRFDNRDTGLSTRFEEKGVPDLAALQGALMRGERLEVPYTLDDMADDAAGLLDALGMAKAHVCGMSMGGMIAQTLALRHPFRVSSLISIYSHTGNPALPRPKPEVLAALMTPPPQERGAFIDNMVRVLRTISGPAFPPDEGHVRKLAAEGYDRGFYPQGAIRQAAAMMVQPNRKPVLASLKVPTLVIHGKADPLVPVEGGKDTAEAIPGARLLLIEDMGHDIPYRGAWPRIADAIAQHTRKAHG